MEFVKLATDPNSMNFVPVEDRIVGQLMGSAYAGMTVDQFQETIESFYKTWKHPKLNAGLNDLTYEPMKQLINFLRANDFKVYIFTADEGVFLKFFSEELYGIPRENVCGTEVALDYKEGTLYRTDRGQYLNNWDAKPKKIMSILGKKPDR